MVLNMMLIHQVRDMLMPIIFLIFQGEGDGCLATFTPAAKGYDDSLL